jgi:hypothetical protein
VHSRANDQEAGAAAAGVRLLLSEQQAQATLGLGYQSLRKLRLAGEIRTVTVGTRVLYPVAELERWISAKLGKGGE